MLMFVLVLPLMKTNPSETTYAAAAQGSEALSSHGGSLHRAATAAKFGPRLQL